MRNRELLKEVIAQTLEAITEQESVIQRYDGKIPQIEIDLIMENIRRLYENFHFLDKMNGEKFRIQNSELRSNEEVGSDEEVDSRQFTVGSEVESGLESEVETEVEGTIGNGQLAVGNEGGSEAEVEVEVGDGDTETIVDDRLVVDRDEAPYHFGFLLAVNEMLFTVDLVDNMSLIKFTSDQIPENIEGVGLPDSAYVLGVLGRSSFGFTIGIIGNLRLGKYFDLRFVPDLAFGERELIYTMDTYRDGVQQIVTTGQGGIPPKKIYSTIIELPLELKYKSKRYRNTRAYVIGGVKYNIDLASEAKKNQDEVNNKHIRLNRHDVMFEVGVGFDFYTTYFKFGTELKMGYSMNDLLVHEDNIYTDVIDKLTSKIFQLSFTFE